MAEIEGIPPRLLSAVRAEVKKSTEEQLNDLWMVVHSLRDGMGGGGGGPDLSPRLEEIQAEIESLKTQRSEPAAGGDATAEEVSRLEESLGAFENETADRFSSLEARAEQLAGLQSQVERFEQEMGQQLARQEKEFTQKLSQQQDELREKLQELESAQQEVERLKKRLEETEGQLTKVGKQAPVELPDLSEIERRLASLETAGPPAPALAAAPAIVMPGGEGLTDAELAALPTSLGYEIEDLLEVVITNGATDLHIKPNSKPMVRRNGELIPIGKTPLSEVDCRALIFKALPTDKRSRLHKREEVEFYLS
ncbi:MAG: hypothetical protein KC910_12590, partial [Candidatus Eremiobacteraeota bacterium]|nr:hypothetical protein [Candidatus Eremiobacteraeota bacterium]